MSDLFEELLKRKEEYKDLIKKEGKKALKEKFKEFFTKFPEIKAINWSQYIPSFNDGDACSFTFSGLHFVFKETKESKKINQAEDSEELEEDSEDEDSNEPEGLSTWDYKYESEQGNLEMNKDLYDAMKELESLLSSHEDLLEDLFEVHVKVMATRKGFSTEEYYCGY